MPVSERAWVDPPGSDRRGALRFRVGSRFPARLSQVEFDAPIGADCTIRRMYRHRHQARPRGCHQDFANEKGKDLPNRVHPRKPLLRRQNEGQGWQTRLNFERQTIEISFFFSKLRNLKHNLSLVCHSIHSSLENLMSRIVFLILMRMFANLGFWT